MSDSDTKKKAAKKAAKKKAQQVEASQPLVEEPDELLAEVGKLGAEIERMADDARAQGIAVINGPARVRLVMDIEHAITPQDAVRAFVEDIVLHGLRDFVYLVEDVAEDQLYYVRDGEILSEEDLSGDDDGDEQK